jgi:hypothetical protein
MKIPVTTKAQLSAKSEDSANNLKPEMHELISKIKNSAKDCDILESRHAPTCGAVILNRIERRPPAEVAFDFCHGGVECHALERPGVGEWSSPLELGITDHTCIFHHSEAPVFFHEQILRVGTAVISVPRWIQFVWVT